MRQAAYRTAQIAFSNRLCGEAPPGDPVYTGDFDYMIVVNAVASPENDSLREHMKAWKAFDKLFSEEWTEHLK